MICFASTEFESTSGMLLVFIELSLTFARVGHSTSVLHSCNLFVMHKKRDIQLRGENVMGMKRT